MCRRSRDRTCTPCDGLGPGPATPSERRRNAPEDLRIVSRMIRGGAPLHVPNPSTRPVSQHQRSGRVYGLLVSSSGDVAYWRDARVAVRRCRVGPAHAPVRAGCGAGASLAAAQRHGGEVPQRGRIRRASDRCMAPSTPTTRRSALGSRRSSAKMVRIASWSPVFTGGRIREIFHRRTSPDLYPPVKTALPRTRPRQIWHLRHKPFSDRHRTSRRAMRFRRRLSSEEELLLASCPPVKTTLTRTPRPQVRPVRHEQRTDPRPTETL